MYVYNMYVYNMYAYKLHLALGKKEYHSLFTCLLTFISQTGVRRSTLSGQTVPIDLFIYLFRLTDFLILSLSVLDSHKADTLIFGVIFCLQTACVVSRYKASVSSCVGGEQNNL